MSFDYDPPDPKYEPPKTVFTNSALNVNITKKIKNIIFTINKLNIENFYIGGGLATACFYGTFYSDFDKRFEELFGDVDVYISQNQFNTLLKTNLYKSHSANILEYDCFELKRKIQFINMKDNSIETIISAYDFSINKCFITIELYEKPIISFPRNSKDHFQTIEVENININAKMHSLDRLLKYKKRYPTIKTINIQADKIEDLIKSLKETNIEKKEDILVNSSTSSTFKEKQIEPLKRFRKLDF